MSTRRALAPVAFTALLFASPGHSTMIIEDIEDGAQTGLLTSILGVLAVDVVGQAKNALEVAEETSQLLRAASEVVVDLQYLSNNPDAIFDDAQAGFGASFPELEAIARDVEATRANVAGERAGDPRSLFELMAHARQTRHGAYQTLIAYDNLVDGGLADYRRDRMLLTATAQAAQDVRMESQRPLDAKTAAVITARAAAISATAEAQVAASSRETSRILAQQYVNERKRDAGNEAAKTKNANDLTHTMPNDESVDGLETLRQMRDQQAPVVERTDGLQ